MKRIKLKRVIIVTVVATIIGGLQAWYDHVTIQSSFSLGQSSLYSFESALVLNLISGLVAGFITALTLNFIDDKYRTKPYYQGLLIIVSVFILIWLARNIVEGVLLLEEGQSYHFSADTTDLKNITFWVIIVILTYFVLQMDNKFGPGKLTKIFLGRYHIPREESRIFMFLDLKSSTTIAERLGGVKYHLFLKELFSDVTSPIINFEGEIYQYVGDEIVLSWDSKKPQHLLNYISCFFAIQALLDDREEKYLHQFGVKPRFKAGAHCGTVIAGEVGVIKRDITYSGDVLNTTARIQGQCNELASNFLVSKKLFELGASIDTRWKFEQKGSVSLKGKKESIDLMSVSVN
ncbi:MAG: adenylate/guanylate cyclase domain-containing protein [Bacteroidota bacterium]